MEIISIQGYAAEIGQQLPKKTFASQSLLQGLWCQLKKNKNQQTRKKAKLRKQK